MRRTNDLLTGQSPRGRRRLRAYQLIVVALLTCLVALSCVGLITVYQGYQRYQAARTAALDGAVHLQQVQALLEPLVRHPTLPNAVTLSRLQAELIDADRDFVFAHQALSVGSFALAAHAPGLGKSVAAAFALLSAGDQACQGGLELIHAAHAVEPLLRAGFLAEETTSTPTDASRSSGSPPVSRVTLEAVTKYVESAMAHFNAAVRQIRTVNFSALPHGTLNQKQVAILSTAVARWPDIRSRIVTVDAWLHVAPTLLGVQQPERFLVELMDRGELRPTGGFIGVYGVMTIRNGQIQPFTLNDIYALDVPYVRRAGSPSPPRAYSWWPFSDFALRDSNLSADFPTASKLGIQLLKAEGGPAVQGVIGLTEPVIARMLTFIGPVALPQYHQTATSQNLDALIRLYTETGAMAAGRDLSPSDQLATVNRRFVAVLGRALLHKLHTVSSSQLVSLAQMFLSSLVTKDIQVYSSDKSTEALLTQLRLGGSIPRGAEDTLTAVDANVTGNKANLFTSVTYADGVTLDPHGIASHHLTITYHFNSSADPAMVWYLYGRAYYLTYLRVYIPSSARLLLQNGFNGGDEQINVSDEPNLRMWGGYVRVRNGSPYTLHFVWSVPNAAHVDSAGHWHYSFEFVHQAGSNQWLSLTVAPHGESKPALTYSGILDRDRTFEVTY